MANNGTATIDKPKKSKDAPAVEETVTADQLVAARKAHEAAKADLQEFNAERSNKKRAVSATKRVLGELLMKFEMAKNR